MAGKILRRELLRQSARKIGYRAIKPKPKKKRSTLSALRTASAKRRARKAQKGSRK